MQEIISRIAGEFNGYDEGNVYKLDNGRIFQQVRHHYSYRYAYRPKAKVFTQNSILVIQVEGMPTAVPVTEVSYVTEGVIVSDFTGFEGKSVFHFHDGSVWQQAEYKYHYHYAYRPEATIIDGINGTTLHVEGVDETVRVRRIR